jgi:cytoskeletal protein CcmA (bactofilin family)
MANKIQIKRSQSTATPTALANGELAFSGVSNTLFIGNEGSVFAIAGVRTPGTLTANQALVTSSTGYINEIRTANLVANKIYANGSHGSDGFLLAVDGSGNTYWLDSAGLTPAAAGSNTQVQFNSSNEFAGDADFTFDTATNKLSVAGGVTATSTGTFEIASGIFVANSSGLTVRDSVTANSFSGNGALLTSIVATTLGGNTAADFNAYADGKADAAYSNALSTSLSRNGVYTGNNTLGGTTTTISSNVSISGTINRNPIITLDGDLTGSVTLTDLQNGTLTATIAADSVALGTDTTGDYVASVYAGNGVNSFTGTGEGSSITISLKANTGVTVNSDGIRIGQPVATTDNVTFNDVTINGNAVLGSASSDTITPNGRFAGDLVPSANVTYSLGTLNNRWSDLYLAGSTIFIGDATIAGDTGTNEIQLENLRISNTLTANVATFHGNVYVQGSLNVTGSLAYINVQTLSVTDSIIQLASNNTVADVIDLGFVGNYNTGGGGHEHTGLIRDASTGVYRLFEGLQGELNSSVVDVGGTGYTVSTLVAFIDAGGLTTNASSVAIVANSTVNVSITANTLTLGTALAATSGGTGLSSFATGDILFASSSTALSKLSIGAEGTVLQIKAGVLAYDGLDGGTF